MNAFTRESCGSQSCVPSSEQESCTICSSSTPCWSATEAMQSLSQFELRKLGVTMENFTANFYQAIAAQANVSRCFFNLLAEGGRFAEISVNGSFFASDFHADAPQQQNDNFHGKKAHDGIPQQHAKV